MKDMIIFPEDIARLDGILASLTAKAKLLLAVLINRDGRIVTHRGSLGQVDVVSLAALVAGSTASTLAIANLVGENEFSAIFHQGKTRNIYIDALDENTWLAVVFDDQTDIDRVKVFLRQFERELIQGVNCIYNRGADQIDLDLGLVDPDSSFTDPGENQPGEAPPAGSQDAYLYLANKRKNPQQGK